MAAKKKKSTKKPKDIGDYGDYSKETMKKLDKLVPYPQRAKITQGMNLKDAEMRVRNLAVLKNARSTPSQAPARSGPSAGGRSSLYTRLTGGGLTNRGK